MLTREDLQEIRGVVRDEVSSSEERLTVYFGNQLDSRLSESEQKFDARLDSRISESEQRFDARLKDQLDSRFSESESLLEQKITESESRLEQRLIGQIGELIEENILPQLEELRQDFRFMKAHMVTRFDLEDRLADFRMSFGKKMVRKAA